MIPNTKKEEGVSMVQLVAWQYLDSKLVDRRALRSYVVVNKPFALIGRN